MTNYDRDRQWSDGYRRQIEEILRERCARHFIEFAQADEESDRKKATDFIVRVVGGDIAVRVRSRKCTYRDLTLRVRRESGVETELAKIKNGFARWYLYCWVIADQGPIGEFVLLDLDACRTCGIFTVPRQEQTGDGGKTYFVSIHIGELRRAGCVVVDNVSSVPREPAPVPSQKKLVVQQGCLFGD